MLKQTQTRNDLLYQLKTGGRLIEKKTWKYGKHLLRIDFIFENLLQPVLL